MMGRVPLGLLGLLLLVGAVKAKPTKQDIVERLLHVIQQMKRNNMTGAGGNATKRGFIHIAAPKPLTVIDKHAYASRSHNKREWVTEADQELIVNEHNKYRSSVNPTATNMQKMVWDNLLAGVAQDWVKKCPTDHDNGHNRSVAVGYGIGIGQNMAATFGYGVDWTTVIANWHSEVSRYQYGVGGHKIGHYTQVVNHQASRIGCAYNKCPNGQTVYVCNYLHGQLKTDLLNPYKSGPSCQDCPDNCDNNLCDCGEQFCMDGGTLDVATCTCKCLPGWSGDQCEDCPDSDPMECGVPAGYTEDMCVTYANVQSVCPYMCDLCGEKRNLETVLRKLLKQK